jgi:hypothetical protein
MRTGKWFLIAIAVVILTVVGIGYTPAIFVPLMKTPQMHHALITVHLGLVSVWLLAFAAQVLFAAAGKWRWHAQAGRWAFVIATIWALSALVALAVDLHLDPTDDPGAFTLLTRITAFSVMMAFAWRERRNPQVHARLVVLAMSQAFIGGINQLPIGYLGGNYDRALWVSLSIPAALVLYDLLRMKKCLPVTIWAGLSLLIVQILNVTASTTPAWRSIARSVGSWKL